jgi:L-cysteine desulfidase
MAVGLAVDSVYVSLEGVRIPSTEGVVGDCVLDTLKNLQRIVETGMPAMDAALIALMEEKKPAKKRYN